MRHAHRDWLAKLRMKELTPMGEYLRSLLRVAATTSGVCTEFGHESVLEQNLCLALVVFGIICYFLTVANIMHMVKINLASNAKYYEMKIQLTQFMKSKNLPPKLTERALDFYDFRYYRSYFAEKEIMETVSLILKKDIVLHQCNLLVDNVPLFTHLPAAAKQRIVMHMQRQFYQSSDVIIKVYDTANSMYFIKSGTVAIYSAENKEIRHLEDGDFFGEIEILVLNVDRVATVMAIEDCELYCLQRDDFHSALHDFPDVLQSMSRIAEERLKWEPSE